MMGQSHIVKDHAIRKLHFFVMQQHLDPRVVTPNLMRNLTTKCTYISCKKVFKYLFKYFGVMIIPLDITTYLYL